MPGVPRVRVNPGEYQTFRRTGLVRSPRPLAGVASGNGKGQILVRCRVVETAPRSRELLGRGQVAGAAPPAQRRCPDLELGRSVAVASPILTDIPVVPAVLEQARRVTVPAARDAIATLHPGLARVAGYHCGVTDQHGRPVTAEGGKMLRPAMVLLSARTAAAASAEASPEVVAGAVAVQLVHEFSLLHDDVMDGDRMRRGRPAAWTVYGIDTAILTGDALLALAVSLLAGHPLAEAVLAEAMVQLCAGQADDLTLQTQPGVTVADWDRMAAGKTSALLAAACQIGALLADADHRTAIVLGTVGAQLGLAFQAVDDWLGIWGDPHTTRKPVGADIAARKRSLPIVVALVAPHPAAHKLAAILATDGELTTSDITTATALLEQAHADDITRHHARAHAGRARDTLAAFDLPPSVQRDWDELVTFLTTRAT